MRYIAEIYSWDMNLLHLLRLSRVHSKVEAIESALKSELEVGSENSSLDLIGSASNSHLSIRFIICFG